MKKIYLCPQIDVIAYEENLMDLNTSHTTLTDNTDSNSPTTTDDINLNNDPLTPTPPTPDWENDD